ncbi:MAG: CHAT domain-containing protein [Byssovorax sp.]
MALKEDLLNELRLIFSRDGGAITYRLATSWGDELGEAQAFVPFLSRDDDEDLRWYLEEYMELPIGGALVRARRIEQSLAEWGRRLFDAVFDPGERRELFDALIDGKGPRLLLTVATKDIDVLRLPWELMANDRGPLTRRGVTIRRQLETARRAEVYETGKLPLRILLAVSRPDDSGFIDPRHTTRAMLEALGPLGDGVVVDFCRPASLDEMERMLGEADRAERPYQIVHFDGHGSFDPVAQTSVLYFERDGLGSRLTLSDEVPADSFGALMAQRRVPLVILEACRSGQVGHGVAFRGVAPALIEAGVGSVLAMSHAVHVEAAKVLLARFYAELAVGATIGEALEQGRSALVDQPERWLRRGPGEPTVTLSDWFLPQLYQLGDDRVLVPGELENGLRSTTTPEVRRAPAQGNEVGAFPGEPMYGFFGRAHELHRLERRFLKHRAVVLHAMGGMGKTSLAREAAFWWTRPTGLFPDGACFVSFEQAGGARRAVQVIGAYFEGAEFEKRSEEEQGKRAKELFQTRRVLVVWDNFESVLPAFQEGEAVAPYPEEEREEIYRLFTEWTDDDRPSGRLLVTCRPGATGLLGACKVELAGLARADALSLLHGVMQKAGVAVAHEREAIVGLLETLTRHPLSIELVGPHLKDIGPEEILADFRTLLGTFEGEAAEGRNRSLSASIEFSLKRLSKEAREAVRWLGLFRGGVFEAVLLHVSQMDPLAWHAAREELEATALVKVSHRDVLMNGRRYLQFHPTLAHAAGNGKDDVGMKDRHVEVYAAVTSTVTTMLMGPDPHLGMDVMVREEWNVRIAVQWALDAKAHRRASGMGTTLRLYLERSGRLRERDWWAAWLSLEVGKGGFSEAVVNGEKDEAWALASQGRRREAIAKLEALVDRLKKTTEFDAASALADAIGNLGKLYHDVGLSQKAIPMLEEAVKQCEALAERTRAEGESVKRIRRHLAFSLSHLANALHSTGNLDRALAHIERANTIARELDEDHNVAAGLGQIASILVDQGRYAEADARHEEVLQILRRAGDRAVEATTLQHQGMLADDRKHHGRATALYRRALQIFQDMHHEESVMHTCNLLGVVEQHAGRLIEARAWYQRSREIAERRGAIEAVGIATQNLGNVCRLEGIASKARGEDARGREYLADAARFACESLAIKVENQDEPGMAAIYCQFAQIHLVLDELDQAEAYAHRAREICEHLGLKNAPMIYNILVAIAEARNNSTETAIWEQKRDALVAEFDRRAGAPALAAPCPCGSGKPFLDCHAADTDEAS